MRNLLFSVALSALLAVSCIYGQLTPQPGNLKLSASVPSVNNIMEMALTILPNYMINNKTFAFEFKQTGMLYKIKIDKVYVDTVAINNKQFEFLPNSNTLRIVFSDVDIVTKVHGTVYAMYFIPIHTSDMVLKGCKFAADLEVLNGTDGVHWQIRAVTVLDVKRVDIKLKNKFFNKIMGKMQSMMLDITRKELKTYKKMMDDWFKNLNHALAINNQTFFLGPLKDPEVPMNFSTTAAPYVDKVNQLVEINFDGTLFDLKAGTNHLGEVRNTRYPPRLDGMGSEQFWLHQSSVASFFYGSKNKYFPMALNNTEAVESILQLLPEISAKFGSDAKYDVMLNLDAENPNFFTSSINDGYQIGKGAATWMNVLLYAETPSMERQVIVEFKMRAEASFKFVFDSFFVTLNIPEMMVTEVDILYDQVGLYDRDYDAYLNNLINVVVENVNQQWAEPWDLADLDPTVGFLRSMFTNLQLSPYVEDEFIFFGFSYMLDMMMVQANQGHVDNIMNNYFMMN